MEEKLVNKVYELIQNKPKSLGYWDFKKYYNAANKLYLICIDNNVSLKDKSQALELQIITQLEEDDVNLEFMLEILRYISSVVVSRNTKYKDCWRAIVGEIEYSISLRY